MASPTIPYTSESAGPVRVENITRERLSKAVGKDVILKVDYGSFEFARDISRCHQVLTECAMDRIAGAFEWFCEWPSCRRILQHSLVQVEVRYSEQASAPRVRAGHVVFEDTFSSAELFPQANTIAHVLDETFGLYRGRVYDIRQKLIPSYEKQLRDVLGVNVDLRLNIEAFGLLDWEEDNFYNAYTQLVPNNADAFFGRLPEAISELCVNKQDRAKLQENVRVVEIKLSLKSHKRINLKGNRLKLSERFWNGIEHNISDIKTFLVKKLSLGFDVQLWISEMHNSVIPYWTERMARTLNKRDGVVPIAVSWKTFADSEDMVQAVSSIYAQRSALVLARINTALQICLETFPQASQRLTRELTRIRIKCSDSNPRKTKCKVKPMRDRLANPKQYDRHGNRLKHSAPLRKPTYYGKKLVVSAQYGQGEAATFSVEQIVNALSEGFNLVEPVNDEHFFITNLVQDHQGAELHGRITGMNMFQEVFGMMEGYNARMQSRARTFLSNAAALPASTVTIREIQGSPGDTTLNTTGRPDQSFASRRHGGSPA